MLDRVPTKPSAGAIAVSAAIGVALIYALALSIFFEPPANPAFGQPLVVHPVAPQGTSCRTFPRIFASESASERFATRKETCVVAAKGIFDPRDYSRPGELIVVLDPDLPVPGGTGEYRLKDDRYFVMRINPNTFNSLTWSHEFAHLTQGHTALRLPSLLELPTNVLLDLVYVDPYLLFGEHWQSRVIVLSFLLCLLTVLVKRRRRERG